MRTWESARGGGVPKSNYPVAQGASNARQGMRESLLCNRLRIASGRAKIHGGKGSGGLGSPRFEVGVSLVDCSGHRNIASLEAGVASSTLGQEFRGSVGEPWTALGVA